MSPPPALAPRIQPTPHGPARITSRWRKNRYQLRAQGPESALRWLFPSAERFEVRKGGTARRTFAPAPEPVDSLPLLDRVCDMWQTHWSRRLEREEAAPPAPEQFPLEAHADEPVVIVDDETESDAPTACPPPPDSAPPPPRQRRGSKRRQNGPRTLGQLVEHVAPLRALEISGRTADKDAMYMRGWLEQLGHDYPLADLTQEVVRRVRAQLVADKWKPSTANSAFAVLATYLSWAEREELVERNPCRGVRKLKEPHDPTRIKWWEPWEIHKALEAAREVDGKIAEPRKGRKKRDHFHTAELLIALGCYCGMRWEEIIMQRWDNLVLDSPQPLVHVVPVDDWAPKDREARTIPICKELLAILERCRQPTGWLLVPEKEMPRRGGRGHRSYRFNPQKLWKQILAAAMEKDCKRITPHGMRHSFASNLLGAGVSDVKVARWLGHADTTMVHQRYGHLMAWDGDIERLG